MGSLNPITLRLRRFKRDMRNKENYTAKDIVRKWITFGIPYIFRDDEEEYYKLKGEIADYFNVNPLHVVMSGSAKLGFSLNPTKLWAHINQESDIDVAIINSRTFDEYWEDLFGFDLDIEKTARSEEDDKRYKQFLKYLFKGWIRPDLFPFDYEKRKEWRDFTSSIYNKYDNRKVSVGIFRNEYFFESYHINNIKEIRSVM